MYPAPDFLAQVTQDRQQDRLAAAAEHRLVTELVAQEEHPQEADAPRAQIPEGGRERLQALGA